MNGLRSSNGSSQNSVAAAGEAFGLAVGFADISTASRCARGEGALGPDIRVTDLAPRCVPVCDTRGRAVLSVGPRPELVPGIASITALRFCGSPA